MTDAEKCRLIAEELEGYRPGVSLTGVPYHIIPPDYAHDLNATMRAARRLLPNQLVVESNGGACIENTRGEMLSSRDEFFEDDPARAAFEALAAWMMERGK